MLTKRREYEERIVQVEHSTFTPLIFPSFGGGMGTALKATVILKSAREPDREIDQDACPFNCVHNQNATTIRHGKKRGRHALFGNLFR